MKGKSSTRDLGDRATRRGSGIFYFAATNRNASYPLPELSIHPIDQLKMANLLTGWAITARHCVHRRTLLRSRRRLPSHLCQPTIQIPSTRAFVTSSSLLSEDSQGSKDSPDSNDATGNSTSPPTEADLSSIDASTPTRVSAADFAASLDPGDRREYDALPPEEQHEYQVLAEAFTAHMSRPSVESRMHSVVANAAHAAELEEPHSDYVPEKSVSGFANMGEEDEKQYPNDREFQEDDITSAAHGQLEQHREIREYARIAAWEMPLLSSTFLLPRRDDSDVW